MRTTIWEELMRMTSFKLESLFCLLGKAIKYRKAIKYQYHLCKTHKLLPNQD